MNKAQMLAFLDATIPADAAFTDIRAGFYVRGGTVEEAFSTALREGRRLVEEKIIAEHNKFGVSLDLHEARLTVELSS